MWASRLRHEATLQTVRPLIHTPVRREALISLPFWGRLDGTMGARCRDRMSSKDCQPPCSVSTCSLSVARPLGRSLSHSHDGRQCVCLQPRTPGRLSLPPQRRVLRLLTKADQSVVSKGILRGRGGMADAESSQAARGADLIASNNIRRRLSGDAGRGDMDLRLLQGRGSRVTCHFVSVVCLVKVVDVAIGFGKPS
ncbi:hypothetical protein LY78DRAFT_439920 [Colletotrichum sublineola]|nr:hypothetical protein LY78DRAFT_439920 [Colletotrichum sublineola]